jgi:cyclic beta-1,2-glucan synthetase
LGFFLYGVLRDFVPVVTAKEGCDAGARLIDRATQLKTALDRQWREQRYVRAITDSGEELVFDDALMSSWPILSGVADTIHGETALRHGLNALERDAMILLLNPAFDKQSKPYPGRIAQYPPGVRENGAQYSHGSSWLVDAALQLAATLEEQGNISAAKEWRDRAGVIWHKISPLTHTAPQRWLNYGLEPHQQAADVYSGHGYEGRGGWSWYTGSAARMLTAARSLLGLEFRDGQLHVAEWAKNGDVWPHLQSVEWRGELIEITAPVETRSE